MKVTEASRHDIPLLHTLADRIWKAYYPAVISMDQILYMLEKMYSAPALEEQMNEGQRFFLLMNKGHAEGYLSYSNKGQGHYFLHKLYIETNLHRSGAGHFLFDEVFGKIKDIHTLRLTVNRQNFKAINFYFKKGFIIEEVKDFDIGHGYVMNDFVMIKNFISEK